MTRALAHVHSGESVSDLAPEGLARREPSASATPRNGKTSAEVTALVSLAEIDASVLDRAGRAKPLAAAAADERRRLATRLSREVAEAYERARRGGRQPAVVRMHAGVCTGCHVRLHATLEQRIRRARGVAACPHCLRLVYDPEWLVA